MLPFDLGKNNGENLEVLCIGAHSDDIEIGCGGTLLHLASSGQKPRFHWVVLSACEERRAEAAKAAKLFAGECERQVEIANFRDGFLPYAAEVKDFFEALKSRIQPDLIFTHWDGDAHQDHRLVSELTWNTFRNHFILEYEVPKYDGDLGRPNLFVSLEAQRAEEKVNHLLETFSSQRAKPWFDRQVFMGLMRIRGMECVSPSGYAEAFHCRKIVVR